MSYTASAIGRGGPGEPQEDAGIRGFLLTDGGTLPPRLPTIAIVREQMKTFIPLISKYLAANARPQTTAPTAASENSLELFTIFTQHQSLFHFSVLAVIADIPHDLAVNILTVLEILLSMTGRNGLRASLEQSTFCGVPMDPSGCYKLQMTANNRKIWLSLRHDVNLPVVALKTTYEMVQQHKQDLIDQRSPYLNTPWRDPDGKKTLYVQLADALVFSNKLGETTKYLLEQLWEWAKTDHDTSLLKPSKALRKNVVLIVRTHLSLVLSQLEGPGNAEKSKQHTDWVVSKYRPNRHVRASLASYVLRPGLPEHPVAKALGPEWFDSPGLSWRPPIPTEIPSKFVTAACGGCEKVAPRLELLKCSRCQSVFYWCVGLVRAVGGEKLMRGVVDSSRECQKAAWKQHKSACKPVEDAHAG
ncbi:hypothetical protein EIP91_005694 [Steccherinum ochraceum]|uniref:MYND-type domain-containing protein n=1 Tax=Steccherinum ochraceum TaxID=92696 RepID=A0A4R0R9M3_9APHY|nr:hypothetical protein EIP91_005694 [Steccherinum ochraceum]